MSREIPAVHTQELLSILGLLPGDIMPPTVVKQYWRFKRMVDRVSAPSLDANLLALMVLQSGVEESEIRKSIDARPKPKSPDAINVGDVEFDPNSAQVDWSKVDIAARVVTEDGTTGIFLKREINGTVQVQLDGDSADHRKYDPEQVRLVV